ncbi:MAG: hypothetical protein GXO85_11265 [Chlorobi bacterium]|nr:hypothetical protein [Chlorobiota bacterium]
MGNNKVEKENKLGVTPIELRPLSVTPSYTLTNLEIFINLYTDISIELLYVQFWVADQVVN